MRFFIVDVFAERKYQGNQLAVFILDKSLSTAEMQEIAKEVNFSETTFVNPKKCNDRYDVRIFTPDVEVPFAGHPTLGTAFVISEILESEQQERIILNLGVGEIPVTFDRVNKNQLWMKQKEPTFGKTVQAKVIAEILQIREEEIDSNFPIETVSTGLPAVIIPIKKMDTVRRCAINHEKFQNFINEIIKANLLVFVPQAQQECNDIHARVFMDDPGFLEDPATGSASGNLAAYLLEHNFFNKTKIAINIEQGYLIGRPSLIKVKAEKNNEVFEIFVGGNVFLIAQGEWL